MSSDTHVLALGAMVKRTIATMHARRLFCRFGLHTIDWTDGLRLALKRNRYFSFQIGKCHCCGRIKQRWVGPCEEFSMENGKLVARVPGDTDNGSLPLYFG